MFRYTRLIISMQCKCSSLNLWRLLWLVKCELKLKLESKRRVWRERRANLENSFRELPWKRHPHKRMKYPTKAKDSIIVLPTLRTSYKRSNNRPWMPNKFNSQSLSRIIKSWISYRFHRTHQLYLLVNPQGKVCRTWTINHRPHFAKTNSSFVVNLYSWVVHRRQRQNQLIREIVCLLESCNTLTLSPPIQI